MELKSLVSFIGACSPDRDGMKPPELPPDGAVQGGGRMPQECAAAMQAAWGDAVREHHAACDVMVDRSHTPRSRDKAEVCIKSCYKKVRLGRLGRLGWCRSWLHRTR